MKKRAEKIIMLCTAIVNKRIEVQRAVKLNRELASLEKELERTLDWPASKDLLEVPDAAQGDDSEDTGELKVPKVTNEHF